MRPLILSLIGLGLAAALGCGGSTAPTPNLADDGAQIAALVDRMTDEGNTSARLKESFATGTPIEKKQPKSYGQYRYDVKGKADVSGTTATATVVIEKQSGGHPVEKEWAFVKEGEKWKIKSAPLP